GEGSPGKGSHSFAAQPPDLRHFALITRASRFTARSPCLAAPSIRFLFIGSQLTLHASFPRSVALTQLRFTSFAVINLWRDLHPQECAHAGRTAKRNPPPCGRWVPAGGRPASGRPILHCTALIRSLAPPARPRAPHPRRVRHATRSPPAT